MSLNKFSPKKLWQDDKQVLIIGILSFFLIAGVVQYAFGLVYVTRLTALVVAIISALVVLFWDVQPMRRLILALVAIMVGLLTEIIGVNTGLLFGNYQYGEILGFKIAGVPILIGVTWLLVSVSTWQIISYSSLSRVQKVISASGLVVMFDLLLEQYATAFGLWSWENGIIPLLNYASWFFVSMFLFIIYSFYAKQGSPSLIGAVALPLMSIFFWLMLLVR
jgi:bisanhydrobacterioruberin hydratase